MKTPKVICYMSSCVRYNLYELSHFNFIIPMIILINLSEKCYIHITIWIEWYQDEHSIWGKSFDSQKQNYHIICPNSMHMILCTCQLWHNPQYFRNKKIILFFISGQPINCCKPPPALASYITLNLTINYTLYEIISTIFHLNSAK